MGLHYLSFSATGNWLRLLLEHRVDRGYRLRASKISAWSVLTMPIRLLEAAIPRPHRAYADPVFVLGHWRSGTTYLENLLCCDASFGRVTRFQMVTPGMLTLGPMLLKRLWARTAPTTRSPDHMTWQAETAEEEEWAMAAFSPHSFYHSFFFPTAYRYYLDSYVTFSGSEKCRRGWKATHQKLVRRFSHFYKAPMILKSPANTARIPELLELYPNAHFIHLVRNPLDVFSSQVRTMEIVLENAQLQNSERREVLENVLLTYEVVMRRYLAHRDLIPAGRLIEVRYEALRCDPAAVVGDIHKRFGWNVSRQAQAALDQYAEETSGHRSATTPLPESELRQASERWAFAFKEWGYAVP
jgi:hypothetical protein